MRKSLSRHLNRSSILAMSGFEAVGLIIPLLLTVIEHWDACTRPFIRYRKFEREARDFVDNIEIEKTIFRNECRYLLGNIIEQKTVSGMLESLGHSDWHDAHVDGELAKYLGDSYCGCFSIVNSINHQLQEIGEDMRELSDTLKLEHEVCGDRLYCVEP